MTILESTNPVSGEVIATYEAHTDTEVEQRVQATADCFEVWRDVPIGERVTILERAAGLLRDRQEQYAALMAKEMGKPIREGRSEVEKCAWVCEHYAQTGPDHLVHRVVSTDLAQSYVAYEPLGPILAVMPWNFPFWQVFRFAAPNLLVGNTGLLKHASNVMGCAEAIESVWRDAGLPEGGFHALRIRSDRVESLIADKRVRGVTVTGSTPAGRAVAGAAGRHLKPSVLELGGSDPYVVLEDADVLVAAEACVTGRLINSGQSCIAAKRWIVVDAVREAFTARVSTLLGQKQVGDPLNQETDVGPMARVDLRDQLHDQVQASIEAGARCTLGGLKPERRGAWYPITLLEDVPRDCPARTEELFGPVAAIIPAKDEAEAFAIANETPFGLGAAIFTQDARRGLELAQKRLHAGSCFVNTFVRSDPRLPFGGIGDSGYGRELGRDGLLAFTNAKTIALA